MPVIIKISVRYKAEICNERFRLNLRIIYRQRRKCGLRMRNIE